MSKVTYPASSPYSSTPQSSWAIGLMTPRSIPLSTQDKWVTIDKRYEFRPDLLAYDLYGNAAYWWVFAVCNRDLIMDPVWDLKIGLTFQVPSAANLKKALGT